MSKSKSTKDCKSLVMFSSGITSWAAGKRYAEQHGTDGMVLLFADTLIEDEDNYRFLIESAANIFGQPIPPCAYRAIPPITDPKSRRKALIGLAEECAVALPGLVWIADGRTPWEVMRDVKIIGNSRIDPCSRVLKRDLLKKWEEKHCNPADTTIIFGIGWDESHRIERVQSRKPNWKCVAPLCDKPWISKRECLEWARHEGIEPPRMYDMGFPHANCGGFCIKAGQASFKLLLKNFPERYAFHEAEEEKMRQKVGNHSIMNDRRGDGKKKVLTMRQFRERIESDPENYELDLGGCGCALPQ